MRLAALAPPFLTVVHNPEDDLALARRAQARDERAFADLYQRHVARVYALCLRMSADPARAEELTQTVFVSLWGKLAAFRGESAFTTWLHRLAVNVVLTDLRTTRRREARVFGAEQPESLETPSRPPPAGLRCDLEEAIATLPPQCRTVFVLHDIEGYTHEEIAALMHLAAGTAKAHLHRARQLLQEALQ